VTVVDRRNYHLFQPLLAVRTAASASEPSISARLGAQV